MVRFLAVSLVLSAPLFAGDVRISVLGLFQPKALLITPAKTEWLMLAAGDAEYVLETGQAAALEAEGSLIQCKVQRAVRAVKSVQVMSRTGGPVEFVISIQGKIRRHFFGTLEVTGVDGRLQAVVTTGMEEAVSAAVLAETAPRTAMEALKAQAIVSRSYYYAVGHVHKGFDFCDTTHCQFFREAPAPESAAAAAAKATEGMIVTWKGAPVATQYFAACGGHTRSLKDARLFVLHYPYYAVECRYCREKEPVWESRLDAAEAAELLNAPGSEQARLQIIRRLGFGALPGSDYAVERDGDTVILRGKGRGHGIGLCQAGAAAMAATGLTFRDIVNHYFPNTAISLGRTAGLH